MTEAQKEYQAQGVLDEPEKLWGPLPWWEWALRSLFPVKEIGWAGIFERFTRFKILQLPNWLGGFRIFLHKLNAPMFHPQCHDHPWWFVTLILFGGYREYTPDGQIRNRLPFSILFRPARFVHNVKTMGVSWSLILTGPRSRDWKFDECGAFTRKE